MKILYFALSLICTFIVLLSCVLFYSQYHKLSVYAQEENADTEEVTETQSDEDTEDSSEDQDIDEKEVQELKEKVASKVEEMTETEYGTSGFIQKINDNTLILSTETDEIDILVDEDITEIYAIEKGSLRDRDIDDLEITDYITVAGPRLEGTLNANTIIIDTAYTVRSGKIIEVNEDDFYISVITLDKTTYTLDVEKNTIKKMYNIQTNEIEEVGFSKLKEGDTIHFTAQTGWRDDQDRFSVHSFLIIPQEYFQK